MIHSAVGSRKLCSAFCIGGFAAREKRRETREYESFFPKVNGGFIPKHGTPYGHILGYVDIVDRRYFYGLAPHFGLLSDNEEKPLDHDFGLDHRIFVVISATLRSSNLAAAGPVAAYAAVLSVFVSND